MTPKQSKDVDTSHIDRGDGYTHYEGDDCTPSKAQHLCTRDFSDGANTVQIKNGIAYCPNCGHPTKAHKK